MNDNNFRKKLLSFEEKQFTGRLNVESTTGKQWKLYFCLSWLVWAEENTHPHRSWRRHLLKYAYNLHNHPNLTISGLEGLECWNYYVLTVLLKRTLIQREQAVNIIHSKITEIIFDILQEETTTPLQYSLTQAPNFLWDSGLRVPINIIPIKQVLEWAQKDWLAWQEHNFNCLSPNLAPTINQPEKLQDKVSETTYQNLVKLINGERNLRDLAVKLNQDLIKLTCSLAVYFQNGEFGLIDVADLPDVKTPFKQIHAPSNPQPQENQPLIMCMDDSPQIRQTMEKIITLAGYRFLGIDDSPEAFKKIIRNKPDLIFLDLVMETTNGYEVCSQLRRVSHFKNTPIVILTTNDGLIDRVRAKLVGASAFLSKSIDTEQLLTTVHKLLSVTSEQLPVNSYQ